MESCPARGLNVTSPNLIIGCVAPDFLLKTALHLASNSAWSNGFVT